MKITFTKPTLIKSGAIVVFALAGKKLSKTAEQVDQATDGALTRAIKASVFTGKKGDLLEIVAPATVPASRVVIVGLGKLTELEPTDFDMLGGKICGRLLTGGEKAVAVTLDELDGLPVAPAEAAVRIASGMKLRAYRFDKYHTKQPASSKPTLRKASIHTDSVTEAKRLFARAEAVLDGVYLTRDLVSEPANVLHPVSYAKEIKKLAEDGVDVEVLGEKAMKKLGMGALLAVGQGSDHESQMVIMQWNGAPKARSKKPIAFIGKGVTFDTGGISLKPPQGMEQMKWDMGGSAIVVGVMKALAARKAPVNAVGIVGLVENMPSGGAQRPGDVVTSLSGQTIEVLNTDAEGRLVLADALWYCQDRFKPQVMIDLATLTGAMIVSLGHEHAGVFTDDDTLSERLIAAGRLSGDKVWRMPLDPAYDKLIDSPIADMKNIGGSGAGSITAAQFLKRFTHGVTWAHLDVAGMVWSDKNGALWEKGATGYGVRLLDRFVADTYET